MAIPSAADSRLRGRCRVALLFAAIYSVAIVAAGFLLPVYSQTTSSDGQSAAGSQSLVSVNGLGAALIIAIPLMITGLVWLALWRGGRQGLRVAWVLTGVLGLFNLAAMLTIGLFLLPVTLGLVVACATRPST